MFHCRKSVCRLQSNKPIGDTDGTSEKEKKPTPSFPFPSPPPPSRAPQKPAFPAIPLPNDANLLLFQEKAGSGTYDDSDYPDKWKKEFLGLPNTVNADYVGKHQNDIIACLGYFDFLDILDFTPAKGSAYIHSMSEPYSEEMEFDEKRCDNWLELLGLPKHQIHASGHAPRQDLFKIAATVAPTKLFPIHTVYPEEYKRTGLNVSLPEIGVPVTIK